ncbi:hypothetical protein [Pseudomonas putida]|uniref:hypothetical protein n=1 Tax=Pseudomonas putida TaxID=303 RepID=UPI003810070B
MSRYVKLTLFITMLAMNGCAPTEHAIDPLLDPAYVAALEKQNQAIRSVAVYRQVSVGALGMQPVMAATCGSAPTMTGADVNYILTGLKLKAYQYGANAIAEVDIQEVPGQEIHCDGNVGVGGTAKAFTARQ